MFVQGQSVLAVGLGRVPLSSPLFVSLVSQTFGASMVLQSQSSDAGKCLLSADCCQALNSQRMNQRPPGLVLDAKKGAELVGCPFKSVSVIIEVGAGKAAPRPPEADVGVIVYPAITCPSGSWLG